MKKHQYDDEITLMELAYSSKRLFVFISRHWKLFLISSMVCIGLSLVWALSRDKTYKAELSFMLSDDKGNGIGNFSGVLGQLGIPISRGKYNIDKLLEISRSRRIVKEVLFYESQIGETNDFIANHIIRLYNMQDSWTSSHPELDSFLFKNSDTDQFSTNENFVLKSIYQKIVGTVQSRKKALLNAEYGKDHYIMTFSITSLSETLSIDFVNELFEQVKTFYVQQAIEKNKFTYDLIFAQRDSIKDELITVDRQLALLKDTNLGVFSNQGKINESQLSTQSLILKTALVKAEENLAVSQFVLESNTPLIQKLDSPLAPLYPIRPFVLKFILVGLASGIILSIFILYIRFIFEK